MGVNFPNIREFYYREIIREEWIWTALGAMNDWLP